MDRKPFLRFAVFLIDIIGSLKISDGYILHKLVLFGKNNIILSEQGAKRTYVEENQPKTT
jgi:hypothetical protein